MHRRHPTLHWLKIGLLSVLGLVATVLLAAHVALQTRAGRDFVLETVNDALSDALDARFEIERIDAASVFYVQTGPVHVINRAGQRVASLERLSAHIDPFSLLLWQVHVTHAFVDKPFVDLGAPMDEGGGLLALFESEDPEEDSEPSESGSTPRIVIDDIRVAHGEATLQLQGARVVGRDISGRCDLDIADDVSVRVDQVATTLLRDARFVAVARNARFAMEGSGALRGQLELLSDRTHVWAKVELGAEQDDGDAKLRGAVAVSQLSAAVLEVAGLPADWLKAPVDVRAKLDGRLRDLVGHVDLGTPGGNVALTATWKNERNLVLDVATAGFSAAQVVTFEVEPVAVNARLVADSADGFDTADLRVAVNEPSYAHVALPHVFAIGRYESASGLRIDQLDARYPDSAQLRASGHLSPEGEIEVQAALQSDGLARVPAVVAWAPGLAGKLDAHLHLRKSANDALSLRTSVLLTRGGYGGASVDSLSLEGHAEGSMDAPTLQATLRVRELLANQVHLPSAELNVSGGPARYDARARFGDRGGLFAHVDHEGDDWTASGDGVLALQENDWLRAGVAALHYRQGAPLTVKGAHVRYRQARADVDGTLSLTDNAVAHLRAKLSVPNIQTLAAGWATLPVSGAVTLDAALDGRLERPVLKVDARYRCHELYGLRDVDIKAHVSGNLPRRQLQLNVDLHALDAQAKLSAQSTLRGRALSLAAFTGGQHDLSLQIDRLPLSQIKGWPRDRFDMRVATLAADLKFRGTLEAPEVELKSHTRLHFIDDPAPVTLTLNGHYVKEDLLIELGAQDAQGALLSSNVHTTLARSTFDSPQTGVLELLTERAWDAKLSLSARRIDELPAIRALQVTRSVWPAKLAGEAKFSHQPGQEPEAELQVSAAWPPPAAHEPAASCGQSHSPRIAVDARMKDGKLAAHLLTNIAGKDVLDVHADSHAPIGEWLRPKQARPVSVVAKFAQLQLSDLPVICEQANGRVSGTASLSRALTQQVNASVDLRGTQMRWGKAPLFEANVSAKADDKQLVTRALLRTGKGTATATGNLPIDAGGRMPSLRMDAPIQGTLALKDMELTALLGAVPVVSARSGTLNGTLDVNGTLTAPNVRGEMSMHDVSVVLPQIGQPFEHVNGKISLDGKKIQLSSTRVHDRDGWADVSGELTMQTFEIWKAKAKLHANDFPVRRSGVILARVDTHAELAITADAKNTQLDVRLEKTNVELTGADLGDIQSLEKNPDIVMVVDNQVQTKEDEDESTRVTTLNIDASEPLWIRREDFSAQLRTRLHIRAAEGGPNISGQVDIDRGVVELLGQMFDIEHGNIRFQGGTEIKPVLDLVASRQPPGGKKVTIEAQGQLDQLKLRFLLDDAPVTAGEALAAATGTRTSDDGGASVQQEIGSMATGIAAGVLTLGARREFGEWVPVLAYENGGGESRVRAGVGARSFIPKFMRKAVVDAYVEGIFTRKDDQAPGAAAQQSGSRTDAGVLLELRFPKNFVSETQYGPGTRWSQDLSWEP